MLLNVEYFSTFIPGDASFNHISFCKADPEMNKPAIIQTGISGLTNQLMVVHQTIFAGRSLGIPVELMGYLDIGCDDAWPLCAQNRIIPGKELFDYAKVSSQAGVSIKDVDSNVCYSKTIPFNATTPLSKDDFKGRTKLHIAWASYFTDKTDFSWIRFVGILRNSLNLQIWGECQSILGHLDQQFYCVHPRNDKDSIDAAGIKKLVVRQDKLVYLVTRKHIPKLPAGVVSKFTFGNYSSNARALLLDACICSDHKAAKFTGTSFSTFSMLIAAMRTANGVHNNIFLSNSYGNEQWYHEYYGQLNLTII
jgi:hypothetical protein